MTVVAVVAMITLSVIRSEFEAARTVCFAWGLCGCPINAVRADIVRTSRHISLLILLISCKLLADIKIFYELCDEVPHIDNSTWLHRHH